MGGFKAKLIKTWAEHGSTILTGVSVVAAIVAPILSATATPKALKALEDAENKKYENYIADHDPDDGVVYEPLTKWEKAKVMAKYYIPTAAVTITGIGASIGSEAKNQKAIANISTAYSILSTSSQLFEKKVAENVSADKLNKIRADVAADEIKNHPKTLLLNPNNDNDRLAWFKDDFSKAYFRSDTVTLERARNEINNTMLNEGFVSLNEWYILIGIEPVEYGWEVGWRSINLYGGELMNFHIEYSALDDGTPCGLLTFSPAPTTRKTSTYDA